MTAVRMDFMDSMQATLMAAAHAVALVPTPISVVVFTATLSLDSAAAFLQQQGLTVSPVKLGSSGMELAPVFHVTAISLDHWTVTAMSPQDSVSVLMRRWGEGHVMRVSLATTSIQGNNNCSQLCVSLTQPHSFSCLQCQCNPAGSTDPLLCDAASGQCHCKRNVMGLKCDTCRNGFQQLEMDNPLGCSPGKPVVMLFYTDTFLPA